MNKQDVFVYSMIYILLVLFDSGFILFLDVESLFYLTLRIHIE